MGDEYLSVEHLMIGIFAAATPAIKRIFADHGITKSAFTAELSKVKSSPVTGDNPESTYDALSKYGTDLVARLLSHRHRHLSVGKLLMGIDVLVVVFSMVAYQSPESALYAVIAIFVSTRMIDSVLYGTSNGNGKLYFILSEKYEEISRKILEDLDRGVTLIPDKGGYSGRPGEMILCASCPSEVMTSRPSVSLSSRPAGMQPIAAYSGGSRSITVFCFLSRAAVSVFCGLFIITWRTAL